MQYTVKNSTSVTVYIVNNLVATTVDGIKVKILKSSFHLTKPQEDQHDEVFAIPTNYKYVVSLSNKVMIELNVDDVCSHFTFNYIKGPAEIYIEFAKIKPGTN